MHRNEAMECFHSFPVYGITAEALSAGRDNLTVVEAMLRAGIKFIQYREKEKSALARYNECLQLKVLTAEYHAAFIIDDFVDLAMAVDADGVHIGQDDLPPDRVREMLGNDKIIGLSTHNPQQLTAANTLTGIIDYIGVGPVYATQTKASAVPAGLEYVKFAREKAALPFVAIGGIKEHNIHEVKSAGADYVCVVSDITGAADIQGKIRKLAEAMK